jgi:flagellar biogenesis protein FliO
MSSLGKPETSGEGRMRSAPDTVAKSDVKRTQPAPKKIAAKILVPAPKAPPAPHPVHRHHYSPKPVAVAVKHPVITQKPAAIAPKPVAIAVKRAVVTPKPVAIAVKHPIATPKPVAMAVNHAVITQKPATIAPKPVAVAIKHAVAAPKPVAVAVKHAVITPKPATIAPKPVAIAVKHPVAAPKPVENIDSMTKDGILPTSSHPQEGQGFSPVGQIGRMFGSLIVVLGLIYGFVLLLKKNPALLERFKSARNAKNQSFPHIPAGAIPINLPMKKNAPDLQLPAGLMAGLDIVSTQSLKGSGTVIYLVRAADRMMLLGASPQGGVRTLAEWDIEENRPVTELSDSFDAFLKSDDPAPTDAPISEAEFSIARLRLRELASRISRRAKENDDSAMIDGKLIR